MPVPVQSSSAEELDKQQLKELLLRCLVFYRKYCNVIHELLILDPICMCAKFVVLPMVLRQAAT